MVVIRRFESEMRDFAIIAIDEFDVGVEGPPTVWLQVDAQRERAARFDPPAIHTVNEKYAKFAIRKFKLKQKNLRNPKSFEEQIDPIKTIYCEICFAHIDGGDPYHDGLGFKTTNMGQPDKIGVFCEACFQKMKKEMSHDKKMVCGTCETPIRFNRKYYDSNGFEVIHGRDSTLNHPGTPTCGPCRREELLREEQKTQTFAIKCYDCKREIRDLDFFYDGDTLTQKRGDPQGHTPKCVTCVDGFDGLRSSDEAKRRVKIPPFYPNEERDDEYLCKFTFGEEKGETMEAENRDG